MLADFELDLMSHDFRVWTVHTSRPFPDPPQAAMQIRRALIDWSNGRWNVAANWTVVWITFGESWLDGDNPIPWPSHAALWKKLAEYSDKSGTTWDWAACPGSGCRASPAELAGRADRAVATSAAPWLASASARSLPTSPEWPFTQRQSILCGAAASSRRATGRRS